MICTHCIIHFILGLQIMVNLAVWKHLFLIISGRGRGGLGFYLLGNVSSRFSPLCSYFSPLLINYVSPSHCIPIFWPLSMERERDNPKDKKEGWPHVNREQMRAAQDAWMHMPLFRKEFKKKLIVNNNLYGKNWTNTNPLMTMLFWKLGFRIMAPPKPGTPCMRKEIRFIGLWRVSLATFL